MLPVDVCLHLFTRAVSVYVSVTYMYYMYM